MKHLKIRFVEHVNDDPNSESEFLIQTKSFIGIWKYITYTIDMGYGSVCNYYSNSDKNKLLDEVLEKHFETTRKFVVIEEHPLIKIY